MEDSTPVGDDLTPGRTKELPPNGTGNHGSSVGTELNERRLPRWIIAIGTTVLLGAVGSGLWDVCLKPGLLWAANAFLTVVTLGLRSAKNSVYEQIAMGNHELASLHLLLFLSSALLAIPIGIPLGAWLSYRFVLRRPGTPWTADSDRLLRKLRRWNLGLAGFLLVMGSFFFVRFLMVDYENLAVTYFQQSFAICKPYLETAAQDRILSRFAQVRGPGDYARITEELREVAAKHQLRLPEFEPW